MLCLTDLSVKLECVRRMTSFDVRHMTSNDSSSSAKQPPTTVEINVTSTVRTTSSPTINSLPVGKVLADGNILLRFPTTQTTSRTQRQTGKVTSPMNLTDVVNVTSPYGYTLSSYLEDNHGALSKKASMIVGVGFIPGIILLYVGCRYVPEWFSKITRSDV